MNVFQLCKITLSNEAAIEFLRLRGILRSIEHPPRCTVCQEEMKIAKRESTGDGEVWRCRRRINGRQHNKKVSIRRGIFL